MICNFKVFCHTHTHACTHTYKTVITVSKVTMCHDHLDAGGFRQVEETILLLTWHKVQDTELHMRIRSYKSITNYDIILVLATIITTIIKIPHSFPLKIKHTTY